MTSEIQTDTTQSTFVWTIFVSIVVFLVTFIGPKSSFQYGFKPQMKWLRLLASHFARRRLTRLIRDFFQNNHENSDEQESFATVSGIFVYPVKSLRAVSMKTSTIDSLGLMHDRRFMIVRPSTSITTDPHVTHRFLTQRQAPILATITASLPQKDSKNQNIMTLSHAQTKTKIDIPTSDSYIMSLPKSQRLYAGIWDDTVEVVDMGDEAAQFITHILQSSSKEDDDGIDPSFEKARLVALLPSTERSTDEKFVPYEGLDPKTTKPPCVALTDGYPILIASETSLMEFNTRLTKKDATKDKIPMNRFRPNIVLSNVPTPFEEDTWKTIMIGDVLFHLVKACPRCKQSCTDQMTGERFSEPLETLSDFRKSPSKSNGDVYFAMNAIVGDQVVMSDYDAGDVYVKEDGSGTKKISVGDKVRILKRGTPVWGDEAAPE